MWCCRKMLFCGVEPNNYLRKMARNWVACVASWIFFLKSKVTKKIPDATQVRNWGDINDRSRVIYGSYSISAIPCNQTLVSTPIFMDLFHQAIVCASTRQASLWLMELLLYEAKVRLALTASCMRKVFLFQKRISLFTFKKEMVYFNMNPNIFVDDSV